MAMHHAFKIKAKCIFIMYLYGMDEKFLDQS